MAEISQDEIRKKLDERHIEIESWESFHEEISDMTDSAWIFRGVPSPKFYPIPSIGREEIYGEFIRKHEERLFNEFKKRAVAIIADTRLDDWAWLAFAQHIGVPTRLLDWTSSPLIGAFFALEANNEEDRLIYCVNFSTYLHEVVVDGVSPLLNKKEGRYSPSLLFDRVRAQRGVFTIHPDPTKIFFKEKMRVLRIPNSLVKTFRKRLFKFGVDHWHIYPDTEGLGRQLQWQFKNKIGLGSISDKEKV